MPTHDARRVAAQVKPERSRDDGATVSDLGSHEVAGALFRANGWRSLPRSLMRPESGILGQGTRFAIAGSIVLVVYLGTTTLMANVVDLPFQVALIIGFSVALVVHFSLQRLFVWAHHEEFALPLHHQLGRYLTMSAAQYGLTAASTAVLPSALGVSDEVVYIATVAVVYSLNFVVFRNGIFHAQPAVPAQGAVRSPLSE
jgi:putative flippase GtrA